MAVPGPCHRYHHLCALMGKSLTVGPKQGTDSPLPKRRGFHQPHHWTQLPRCLQPLLMRTIPPPDSCDREKPSPSSSPTSTVSIVPSTIPPCNDRLLRKRLYSPCHQTTTANTFLRPQRIVLPVVEHVNKDSWT